MLRLAQKTPQSAGGGKADLLYRREILRGGLRFGLVTLTQGLGAGLGCFVLVPVAAKLLEQPHLCLQGPPEMGLCLLGSLL